MNRASRPSLCRHALRKPTATRGSFLTTAGRGDIRLAWYGEPAMIAMCAQCGQAFSRPGRREAFGVNVFCSHRCYAAFPRTRRSVADRIWSRVDRKQDGCWLWPGGLSGGGYGEMTIDHHVRPVHRVVWELTHGPIPAGMFVCHHCDVRNCVRPDHLFIGTAADNTRDMDEKHRRVNVPSLGEKHGMHILTALQVVTIRRRLANGEEGKRLAAEFGVTPGTISAIKTRRKWRHL